MSSADRFFSMADVAVETHFQDGFRAVLEFLKAAQELMLIRVGRVTAHLRNEVLPPQDQVSVRVRDRAISLKKFVMKDFASVQFLNQIIRNPADPALFQMIAQIAQIGR